MRVEQHDTFDGNETTLISVNHKTVIVINRSVYGVVRGLYTNSICNLVLKVSIQYNMEARNFTHHI